MSTPSNTPSALPKILATLSDNEARAVIVALFNGTPSFDATQCDAPTLTSYLRAWIDNGAIAPDSVALACARVIAQRTPPAPIIPAAPQPVAPPSPPAPAIPLAPLVIPTLIPQRTPAVTFPTAADQAIAPEPVQQPAPEPLHDAIARAVAEHTQEPAPIAPEPLRTPANTATRVSARSLFADQPKAIIEAIPSALSVVVYNHPDAPAVDSVYAFNADNLALALGALACTPAEHAWLGGPRGTGKTEFARQIAARLGRPFYRVNFNRSTEAADILGDLGLSNGATHWCDGPVAQAVRTPGAILLLDEPTYAAQGHLASLNPVLERDGATVRLPRTGERLAISADVAVYFADNTFGHGDTSGEYIARAAMGSDTLDRVSLFLQFDYLPETTERKVLRSMVTRTCGIAPPADLLKNVCALMKVARTKADAGELSGAPSLRRAAAFCVAIAQGTAPVDAFAATVVRAAPEDSQEALRQIYAATWPHDGVAPAPAPDSANPFANAPGAI